MNLEGLARAGTTAGVELALDLVVLLVIYLNPRSPAGQVTPPRRVGAKRPVAAILLAHLVQWAGVAAVAAAGLEPRGTASLVAFGVTWLTGLAAALPLFRRLLIRLCEIDRASANELLFGKLAVHGVVWLFACVYVRVMG